MEEPELESGKAIRKPRSEFQDVTGAAHASEAENERDPRAGERREVQPVARIVLEVLQIQEGCLSCVIKREPHVASGSGRSS
jgi:hypothetical protein